MVNKNSSFAFYFNKYKNYVFKKYNLKLDIFKIITYIVIFILIFDKATMLLITYLFYKYKKWKSNSRETYTNNNSLVTTLFEPSNNTIALYSKVFKHPELNFISYTIVKIDPTKV